MERQPINTDASYGLDRRSRQPEFKSVNKQTQKLVNVCFWEILLSSAEMVNSAVFEQIEPDKLKYDLTSSLL